MPNPEGRLFVLLALGDQPLGEAGEVVVDGVGALLGRRGGVHARAQGLLDGGAALSVVAGRGPACCEGKKSVTGKLSPAQAQE